MPFLTHKSLLKWKLLKWKKYHLASVRIWANYRAYCARVWPAHFKKRATNKSVISSSKGVRKRQEFLHATISTQKMHSDSGFLYLTITLFYFPDNQKLPKRPNFWSILELGMHLEIFSIIVHLVGKNAWQMGKILIKPYKEFPVTRWCIFVGKYEKIS